MTNNYFSQLNLPISKVKKYYENTLFMQMKKMVVSCVVFIATKSSGSNKSFYQPLSVSASCLTALVTPLWIFVSSNDVVPVARLEYFRALKLSRLESFSALNSYCLLHFRALKLSKLERFRALKLSKLESFRALKLTGQIGEF
jgi:hypothetical protein